MELLNRLLNWVGYSTANNVAAEEQIQTHSLTPPFQFANSDGVSLRTLTETAARNFMTMRRASSLPDLRKDLREPGARPHCESTLFVPHTTEASDAEQPSANQQNPRNTVSMTTARTLPTLCSQVCSQHARLGNFDVEWQNGPDGIGLKIGNTLVPQSNFSTPPGQAFIRSGEYSYKVDGIHSSFAVTHETEAMSRQTVDAFEVQGDTLKIKGRVTTVNGDEHPYELSLKPRDERTLSFDLQMTGGSTCFSEIVFSRDDEMPLTGFGEQFTYTDMSGKLVPMVTEEGGIGRGQWPISPLVRLVAPGAEGSPTSSYFPMSVCHNGHEAWVVDNTQYHEYDARVPGQLKILSLSPDLKGHLIAGEKPAERVNTIGKLLGRLPKLPDWSQFGAIVGIQGGRDVVMSRLNALLKSHVPVSALWIQDWIGQRRTNYGLQLWWNYELDPDHYRDIKELRTQLKAQNIRLLGYVNPMIVDISDKEKCKRNFFEEGRQNGYFVKNQEGEPYPIHVTIYGHMVDLTNPEARAWYKDILKSSFLQAGEGSDLIFDGGMMDFGEGLPFDAVLHDGTPAETFHNQYPVEWARLVNEVRTEMGKDELLFFHRSGFTGSPEVVSTVWAGDQNHTYDRYDGLHSALIGMLTAGMSGLSHSHSDIGGYTTFAWKGFGYTRPGHLLQSWMEYSAFTSLFRSHEGSEPSPNAQVYSDEWTRNLFGRCARIFAGLAEYRSKLMVEASQTSKPVNPSLGFNYPDDKRSRDCDDEFMLGSDVLMAPTLSRWQRFFGRNVYLPPGKWVHMWTGEVYGSDDDPADPNAKGMDKRFYGSPGQPTAFVRQGSALEKELPQAFARWGLGCFGAPDTAWPKAGPAVTPYVYGSGMTRTQREVATSRQPVAQQPAPRQQTPQQPRAQTAVQAAAHEPMSANRRSLAQAPTGATTDATTQAPIQFSTQSSTRVIRQQSSSPLVQPIVDPHAQPDARLKMAGVFDFATDFLGVQPWN